MKQGMTAPMRDVSIWCEREHHNHCATTTALWCQCLCHHA